MVLWLQRPQLLQHRTGRGGKFKLSARCFAARAAVPLRRWEDGALREPASGGSHRGRGIAPALPGIARPGGCRALAAPLVNWGGKSGQRRGKRRPNGWRPRDYARGSVTEPRAIWWERTLSEQSDSSSHSPCSGDRQSCSLFPCFRGEHCRPAQMLLPGPAQVRPLQPEFSSPSKMGSHQLTITRKTARPQSSTNNQHAWATRSSGRCLCPWRGAGTRQASRSLPTQTTLWVCNVKHPQGQTGQGGAGMLYSLERTTPGPTSSAHQAGESSPTSDTAFCNLQGSRMYICEQWEENTHKTPQFRIQGHCRATGERNLAASSKVSAEQWQISAGLGPHHWCLLCLISTSPSRGHIPTKSAS